MQVLPARRWQSGEVRGDARAAAFRVACARFRPARRRLTTLRTADSAPAAHRRRSRRRCPVIRSAARSSAPSRAVASAARCGPCSDSTPSSRPGLPEYGPALANDGSAIAPEASTSITASTVGSSPLLRDRFVFAAAHVPRRGHRRAERIHVGEHVAFFEQPPQVAAVRHHDGPGAARHDGECLALAIHEEAQVRRIRVMDAAGDFAGRARARWPPPRFA